MNTLNETHDPSLRSWIESANATGDDFPIQNLPYCVFRRHGSPDNPRVGIAIGDQLFEVAAASELLDGLAAHAAAACAAPSLNELMRLGPDAWFALRAAASRLLASSNAKRRASVEPHLVPMAEAELFLPVQIGNFTDFFASIFHASNAGRFFRPDNPLMPNYKYVPVAYHGRASSVRVSGSAVRRPRGQIKDAKSATPEYRPSRQLDFELELGFYVGIASELGLPVPIGQAGRHIFGFSLLNDWSARDIQSWEYQPLGPFLAKNFATTISPFVVTAAALEPFRTAAFARPAGDPPPLPHLDSLQDRTTGGLDVTLDAFLSTERMRAEHCEPVRLSRSSFTYLYWTIAQMIAHHTSNGCNLEIGDLIGSGTVSGPEKPSWGSLHELAARGTEPIVLPTGEARGYVEDGDEIIFRASCEREGFARIGFGECRAVILPPLDAG